ncbi:MAG: hypothetical protein AB1649_12775 [Chloroflexota bacterium]
MKVIRSVSELAHADIRELYDGFDSAVTSLDCGRKCSVHNSGGKPFCCDICHAVPAAYKSEWNYLASNTDLWHEWRGDECSHADRSDSASLKAETPKDMTLLACLGPAKCQRPFRALSCRQFPFFPYVTSDYRFIGMACEWEFETRCWVISNLARVTEKYRREFIRVHDQLFALFQDQFDSHAFHSEKMRAEYVKRRKRFPLLHRDGGYYLVSPASERTTRVKADKLPRFGYYR